MDTSKKLHNNYRRFAGSADWGGRIIINQFILNSKQDLKPLEYSDVTFWLYADNLLLINCSSVWDYLGNWALMLRANPSILSLCQNCNLWMLTDFPKLGFLLQVKFDSISLKGFANLIARSSQVFGLSIKISF